MPRRGIVLAAAAVALACSAAWAQQQSTANGDSSAKTSELTQQNLYRVAASAAQISAVLTNEPGLMVELKKWIANDATVHGQIVEDSELTDEGVFDRLRRNQMFRGVATRLLQRYGFLLPKPIPGSEADFNDQLRRRALQTQVERASAQENPPTEPGTGAQTNRSAPARRIPGADAQPGENLDLPGAPPLLPSTPALVRASVTDSSPTQTGAPLEPNTIPTTGVGSTNPARLDSERALMNSELNERASLPAGATSINSAPGQPSRRIGGDSSSELSVPGQPSIIHEPNPFSDVPSLYDLYQKVSTNSSELKRFGADAIRLHGDETSALPTDLPVGADYIVGPGDGLEIDLWGSVAQRIYRVVDREGRVALPGVGPLLVSGHSMGEVQQAVQRSLQTQFRDVGADVALARLRTIRVYVVGEVETPGAYDIRSLSTPLNAIVSAGGTTPRGSLRRVRHFRGQQLIQEVDVYELLLRGVRGNIQRMETGDTLLVPLVGPEITIEGMVRRPAIYELRGETNLAQVLELAGGILPAASLRHIEVERVEAHEKRTMLGLDLPADDAAATRELEGFKVFDGDRVRILPIAPATQDAVYLQGHALRPGRYSFRAGMRLTDLISSYADLMPEPAQYAEIIRLAPPDYRPVVVSFDITAALAAPGSAPELAPLDTVRIYSRYDFVPVPTVLVGGEVRSPGNYRITGQEHLRDAVYAAGGVTPDASLDTAQLIRYNADGTLQITTVNLARALAGDPTEDLILESRDNILVQRNPARVDPPTVYIRGEVPQPGRFPLTANLRVADLIRMSGGLKRSAFEQTADLTRFNPTAGEDKLGEHVEINLATALAGDPKQDLPLHDGDVLTIKQLAGWNDIGASVRLTGEVEHPGIYGIQPGERLSSIVKRAGGFAPQAYVYAAVLTRPEVRELEDRSRTELIQRIQAQMEELKVTPQTDPSKKADQEAAVQQLRIMLERVESTVSPGRMVIRISPDLKLWQDTPNDVVLHSGDSLTVPKTPNFVLVSGAVYNQTAITYRPGRSTHWYLAQAGGATHMADKSGIFVIRADGSIVSGPSSSGWWGGNPLSAPLHPGDMVVVPEKALSANRRWNTVMQTALTVSSIATSAAIAAKF
ncbi:MAG: SLBB domain-containing protein [Candidatus Acidiferrales bacterium]